MKLLLQFATILLAASHSFAAAVVDWNDVHQRVDGFGASSAWMSGTLSAANADMFFSTNTGIGLSLLRTRIAPDVTSWETGIAQQAQARGARVWSTPWSPPVIYKNTNTVNGGSFSNSTANYEAYAAQLAKYAASMTNTYGVPLYAISVQNEPDVNTTNYESCVWTGQQFHDFIPYLYTNLVASNCAYTKIIFPESENWSQHPYFQTNAMNDPAVAPLVGIIANHNYDAGVAAITNWGKPLWQTEVSTFDAYNGSISNGLYWAGRIHSFLTVAQVNAWHFWWLKPAGTDNEGLTDQSYNPAKRMYVLGNYSKFVRPNFFRIGVANTTPALISAFKDSSSSNFVIVAANPTALAINQAFVLTNFPPATNLTPWFTTATQSLDSDTLFAVTNNTFNFILPPLSVVTFSSLMGTNLVLTNSDVLGTSSFDQAGDSVGLVSAKWSNGQWPGYLNDYFTGANTLRTPTNSDSYTFPGRSLTVQNTSGLFLKGASGNKVTFDNLILSNGGVWQASAPSSTFTLAGNLRVAGGFFYNVTDPTRVFINATTMTGSGSLTNTGSGTVVFTGTNFGFTGPLIVTSNTVLQASGQANLGGNPPAFNAAQLFLDNGTFQPTASFSFTNTNSGVTVASAGGIFNVGSGISLTISNPIAGTGNLVKSGSGQMVLAATNPFTGALISSNGTLSIAGAFSAKVKSIDVKSTATFDLTALQGTLSISNTVALGGNLIVGVNRGGSDLCLVASNITCGGTLTISNLGVAFAPGNSFKLFSASNYTAAFANIAPSTPGTNLLWNTNQLLLTGTLSVVSVAPPQFTNVQLVETNLVMSGISGAVAGSPYYLLCTTNLSLPMTNWLPIATNYFDLGGTFALTNPVNSGLRQTFFRLRF